MPGAIHCDLTHTVTDIQLNKSLFESGPGKISYGTTVHIGGLRDWSDGQVLDLAFAAHTKFLRQYDLDTNGPDRVDGLRSKKDKPSVTTISIVDNTAYIATSLKGRGGSYIYDVSNNNPKDDMAGVHIKESHNFDNAVFDGLRQCQAYAVDTDRAHKNMANCGKHHAQTFTWISTYTEKENLWLLLPSASTQIAETSTMPGWSQLKPFQELTQLCLLVIILSRRKAAR